MWCNLVLKYPPLFHILKCERPHQGNLWNLFLPLQTGLQLFTLQSVVQVLTDQRVDDFLIVVQQSHVCRGMNGLVKISQLLPETTVREQIVNTSYYQVSAIFSESCSTQNHFFWYHILTQPLSICMFSIFDISMFSPQHLINTICESNVCQLKVNLDETNRSSTFRHKCRSKCKK